MPWHVFTLRIEEKPGGWKVRSHREVGMLSGNPGPQATDLVAALKKDGYLGEKYVYSENEAGPGHMAVYVLTSSIDAPKLAQQQQLVMGIGNGPSGADWPILALEWTS